MFSFPDDFLWGATTTAYAVEGGAFASDWWVWEQRPGRIAGGADSRAAAGHYERFDADFALARRLGHNAHLLSLEWSRIEPEPGRFSPEVLDHYREAVQSLRTHGIEPLVALQDVTLPGWAAGRGGWRNAALAVRFEAYARAVAEALGEACRWWLPMRAPLRWHERACLEGVWPPGGNAWDAWQSWRTLAAAHRCAYRAIRETLPEAKAGLDLYAATAPALEPDNPWELRAARREEARLRDWAVRAFAGSGAEAPAADFLAVTHAGQRRVRFTPWRPARLFTRRCDEASRPVDPLDETPSAPALLQTLERLTPHNLPLLVAGVPLPPESDGDARCRALLDYASAVARACARGANVAGFLPAPLLDGFEWTRGYTARYGLVHVDRATLARTPNLSAYLLKELYEHGSLREGVAAKFCPGWRPSEEIAP